MKVPPGDSGENAVNARKLARSQAETVRPAVKEEQKAPPAVANSDKSDTVNFSLGKLISEKMKSGQFEGAGPERIAQIKSMIAEGKYNPASDKIAAKVADFLDDEIKFLRAAVGPDEEAPE